MPKYDIKNKRNLKFARFGGLSSVNQRGYDSTPLSIHSPPCKRGFYAFVWPYYEFFLLGGGLWTNYPWAIGTKFSYVRDVEGNIINEKHPEYEKLSEGYKYWSIPTKDWYYFEDKYRPDYDDPDYETKTEEFRDRCDTEFGDDPKWVLVKKPSPKIFEYRGNIWHHLREYTSPSGIIKEKGGWVLSSYDEYLYALDKDMHAARTSQSTQLNPSKMPYSTKNPYRGICKDHLEVFIEKL